MENSMQNKANTHHEYSIRGMDLATLLIQPGFVEGIINDNKRFHDLEKALIHIFRNNREYCIILWNGIPIRLDYKEDIPHMAAKLILFLKQINGGEKENILNITTKNIDCEWKAVLSENKTEIDLTGNFRTIPGNYQKTLNTLSTIQIRKEAFLREWKLVLEQLYKALKESGCKFKSNKANNTVHILGELNDLILSRGIFYQYDKR